MTSDPASAANAEQAVYWNSAPGLKWVENEALLDGMMAAVLERLLGLAAPRPGEVVLDIGCGTGASTLALAAAVAPGGRVVGADISEPQIARARERVAEARLEGVAFQVADVQSHDLGAGAFDLVASRFGVMFFAEPAAAFANMRRAMRPGGRLAFAAWAPMAENPWFVIPRDAAVARVGAVPAEPAGSPGPFGLDDIARGVDLLARAGLVGVSGRTEAVTLTLACSPAVAGALATSLGPAARILRDRGGDADDAAAIARAVSDRLAPYAAADGLRVPARINFFEAAAPLAG